MGEAQCQQQQILCFSCLSLAPCATGNRIYSVLRRKIILIEVNAKYCHLKKLRYQGTLRQHILYHIYRLKNSQFLADIQSCWYFQPNFVICNLPCCPSPLLFGSTLPPSNLPCVNKYTVRKGGGGVTGFCVGFCKRFLQSISDHQQCAIVPKRMLQ